MPLELIWQIPTRGDGRYGDASVRRRGERTPGERSPFAAGVTDPRGAKFNFYDHIHQIAAAAELSGFDGVQIQHDTLGEESWIVAGYLARGTRRLRLLTEFEASWGSSVYAAKNAVSLQRYTGGRFDWQISAGGTPEQRRRGGDYTSQDEVPARIDEFLTVARGVSTQAPFTFKGRFFEVLEGGFRGTLANHPVPSIYLSGETEAAYRLSARRANVHVLPALPLAELAAAVSALRGFANDQGRQLRIGVRIDLLSRDTEEEARSDAGRFWSQKGGATSTAPPAAPELLWPGFATERTGATAALVGSHQQVAERLTAYADAGVTSFIFAAVPHLEEAYRIGAHILPALRDLKSHRRAA